MIYITECPRDAMQGLTEFIPTKKKAEYINALLEVGYPVIDFGSFVSPKAVPQMRDTADVLEMLNLSHSSSKLLAIVANERGAQEASAYEKITILGFPFSISEEFQRRNTNSGIDQALVRVERIMDIAQKAGKQVRIYISMAFGNPYGEYWHPEIAATWTQRIYELFDVVDIALSDTIGSADPGSISALFSTLITALPQVVFSAHLHTDASSWKSKVHAAYQSGCTHFDGAIKGFGGCPMAGNDLIGNMPTENLIDYFKNSSEKTELNLAKFYEATQLAHSVFPA